MYALKLSSDGRIEYATYPQYASAGAVIVEDCPKKDITNYRYVDGEYVYDPIFPPEQEEENATVWDELDAAYQEGVDSV